MFLSKEDFTKNYQLMILRACDEKTIEEIFWVNECKYRRE